MANTIFFWEAANLFVGDHDPTNSKHLTIQEFKLPSLEENTVDHFPGGGVAQIEVAVGINKLESTFKLAGIDPALLSEVGLGSRARSIFTAYGHVVDKRTGASIAKKAIFEGRLGKIETDAHKRGELVSVDYAIKEIMHYELWWNGTEKQYFDFFTSAWRVDGVPQNGDMLRNLGII
jgi:P2 family phage contractile tail tube protein